MKIGYRTSNKESSDSKKQLHIHTLYLYRNAHQLRMYPIAHCSYPSHKYHALSTMPGGANINLTVLSFRPRSVESDLLNAMSSPPATLSRFRGACSVSRITIFSRMSWSALYGTCTDGAAGVRERCRDGDDGVCGDVLAVVGVCAADIRRSMTSCAISSMSPMCAWNCRPQSPDLLSVAAIWCALWCPGCSGVVPRSKEDRSAARYRQPSATTCGGYSRFTRVRKLRRC